MIKYLVLTEGQEVPDSINSDKMEYEVVRIKTSHVSFIYRVLDPVKTPDLATQASHRRG